MYNCKEFIQMYENNAYEAFLFLFLIIWMTYAYICMRYFISNKLVDFCKHLNITITLYSGSENSSNTEEGGEKTK